MCEASFFQGNEAKEISDSSYIYLSFVVLNFGIFSPFPLSHHAAPCCREVASSFVTYIAGIITRSVSDTGPNPSQFPSVMCWQHHLTMICHEMFSFVRNF